MTLNIAMVTIDCDNPRKLAEFWGPALDLAILGDYGEFVFLGREGGINVGLQKVPEPRAGKNRIHLDLRGDGETRAAATERLVKLGATVKAEHRQPGIVWTVLTDPEGNEFCVGEHA
ncbi:VOC family protein [Fodinicola acaciae]|uniref:VOC family protein n=1 Tax=Fodinicola acaciae TaxID=2681555 RepID=UPI0013D89D59|nr:VOC family protein [Fodinicola acaciae]